jgi:ACS family allantoate permease-like MFS transporter
MSHAACKNFAGLFVVRLILGMCEGSITGACPRMLSASRAPRPTMVRSRLHDRFFHVLHAHGADQARWVVVCVTPGGDGNDEDADGCAVLMNGTAQIISGFISYGALHTRTSGFEPWQCTCARCASCAPH